ncbi:hypothetical protein [Herpetosiphon llansteffanensis]|uniref:hypothetical protein n=1 Tax=Herpetosiphon llansteffanensis TaxID=2094568 RepID=UPI000D7C3941|nr:hypothetical protein [Herpetosiphon llansteffanensis]
MLAAEFHASNQLIQAIDQLLLAGFTNLNHTHQTTLQRLAQVYRGTPLEAAMLSVATDLSNGVFQPASFGLLAVARAALQTAQYDQLALQLRAQLGRPTIDQPLPTTAALASTPPLLSSVQHWLMDLAVMGFARLEPAMINAFTPTLAQIQANPEYLRTAALLAGWMHELVLQPEQLPLFRWADLWTRAMLSTLSISATPPMQSVSGTLYPLGFEWRQHATLVSWVLYAVLEAEAAPQLATITQSAYKVAAIQDDQLWLLFPEANLLFESLSTGKALVLTNQQLLAAGQLIWDAAAATLGDKYDLLAVAERHFGLNAKQPLAQTQLAPEQRHPIHLAEPIVLSNYQLAQSGEGSSLSVGEQRFKLDLAAISGSEIDVDVLESAQRLFGLLRFDAGEWFVRPLATSLKKGKPLFIGLENGKVFKKAPKNNAVGILKERASRLLREKS